MPRPSLTEEKRRDFLPIVARTFAELGYRRTTTAELARRCEVRENILYRIWPDKKAMFLAVIDHVYDLSEGIWKGLLQTRKTGDSTAERLLAYESTHHGDFGHYRIVFAGLTEIDDPEIRKALAEMYRRFHRFIEDQVTSHRKAGSMGDLPDAAMTAWAVIGLGTVANITREMGLMTGPRRRRLIGEIGKMLLGVPGDPERGSPPAGKGGG